MVDEKRAIVFVNTKHKCDIVSRQLDTLSYRCTVLHGGKTQASAGACVLWLPSLLLQASRVSVYADAGCQPRGACSSC